MLILRQQSWDHFLKKMNVLRVVSVRRSTEFAALSLPVHRCSCVSLVEKSAGNSKLEKSKIEFSLVVERGNRTTSGSLLHESVKTHWKSWSTERYA